MADHTALKRLLKVKQLRRKLSEQKIARARGELLRAGQAVEAAKTNAVQIRDKAQHRLRYRIDTAMGEPASNQPLLNTRIANLWQVGQHEISDAFQTIAHRSEEVKSALATVQDCQFRLAQSLRHEKRTEGLCNRLQELERQQILKGG